MALSVARAVAIVFLAAPRLLAGQSASPQSAAETPRACSFPDQKGSDGPTVILDFAEGLSSDGRGPYVKGTDGTGGSGVSNDASLVIGRWTDGSTPNPRAYSVNLNNPVPGGAGLSLGIITDRTGRGIALRAQMQKAGGEIRNLHSIPVGQTVAAAMMSVSFHINGQKHILQMGPQPFGHCDHGGVTLVSGAGTTAGTIHRATQTKWIVDLSSGSIGRLFDVSKSTNHAQDKGLYYFRLHYEIGK
jgi:hypothetical protein